MDQLQLVLTLLLSGQMFQVEYHADRTVTVFSDQIMSRIHQEAYMSLTEAVRVQGAHLNRVEGIKKQLGIIPAVEPYAMTADADEVCLD